MNYKDQLRIEATFKNAEPNSAWAFAMAALVSVWTKPALILAVLAVAIGVFSSCLNVFFWRKGKLAPMYEILLLPLSMIISAPYRAETGSWISTGQGLFCVLVWFGVTGLVYSYSRKMILSMLGFRDKRCPEND